MTPRQDLVEETLGRAVLTCEDIAEAVRPHLPLPLHRRVEFGRDVLWEVYEAVKRNDRIAIVFEDDNGTPGCYYPQLGSRHELRPGGTRPPEPDPDPVQEREDCEREAIAAFENLTSAIGAHNPGPTPEQCRHAARLLIDQTADRVRAGEYVILNHAHFSALVRAASKTGARA
jgi:hypothetical protein